MKLSEIEQALHALDSAAVVGGVYQCFIEVRRGAPEVIVGGNSFGLVRLALELVRLALELVRLAQKESGAHAHIDQASIADIAEIDLVLRVSSGS